MEADDQTPGRYPYLISVRGGGPRAARRDGTYYVTVYPGQPAVWWVPQDVKVLAYDPHRDFYQELRAAWLARHSGAAAKVDPAPARPASTAAATRTPTSAGAARSGPGTRGAAGALDRAPTLFERVDAVPPLSTDPPETTTGPSSRSPGVGR